MYTLTCPHCENEFEVNVEFKTTFTESEMKYDKCDCCNKEVRGIRKKSHGFPWNSNFEKMCRSCHYKTFFESGE